MVTTSVPMPELHLGTVWNHVQSSGIETTFCLRIYTTQSSALSVLDKDTNRDIVKVSSMDSSLNNTSIFKVIDVELRLYDLMVFCVPNLHWEWFRATCVHFKSNQLLPNNTSWYFQQALDHVGQGGLHVNKCRVRWELK